MPEYSFLMKRKYSKVSTSTRKKLKRSFNKTSRRLQKAARKMNRKKSIRRTKKKSNRRLTRVVDQILNKDSGLGIVNIWNYGMSPVEAGTDGKLLNSNNIYQINTSSSGLDFIANNLMDAFSASELWQALNSCFGQNIQFPRLKPNANDIRSGEYPASSGFVYLDANDTQTYMSGRKEYHFYNNTFQRQRLWLTVATPRSKTNGVFKTDVDYAILDIDKSYNSQNTAPSDYTLSKNLEEISVALGKEWRWKTYEKWMLPGESYTYICRMKGQNIHFKDFKDAGQWVGYLPFSKHLWIRTYREPTVHTTDATGNNWSNNMWFGNYKQLRSSSKPFGIGVLEKTYFRIRCPKTAPVDRNRDVLGYQVYQDTAYPTNDSTLVEYPLLATSKNLTIFSSKDVEVQNNSAL